MNKDLLLFGKKVKLLASNANPFRYHSFGRKVFRNPDFIETQKKTYTEISKRTLRTEVINFLLSLRKNETTYLEIGVRNPDDNFNLIRANKKYSVDPGLSFKPNPVDFKMTSDEFFEKLSKNEVLSNDIRFDVIFVDGLHMADQVDRDIQNALKYIKDDGFIVLHDCNPPTEWHARENYGYSYTPAQTYWNGTTWKAFFKWRASPLVNSCCIDSDWGVGVLSKKHLIGEPMEAINPFFEYFVLDEDRKKYLNLVDFDTFKKILSPAGN